MTTLLYAPGACSLAPHIVLEWIGAPYEAVRVELGSEELRALNPSGVVPVLREDDGWALTQASAVLDYLAQKHPKAGLAGGESLRERAETHRWKAFFTSDMHTSFWPIFSPHRYTTEDSDAAKKAVVAAGHKLVCRQMGLLDAHMEGRDWVLGDGRGKRSIIDAYAFPMIRWGIRMLPGGLADFPHVQALHDRLAADPAVQRVLAQESGK